MSNDQIIQEGLDLQEQLQELGRKHPEASSPLFPNQMATPAQTEFYLINLKLSRLQQMRGERRITDRHVQAYVARLSAASR